MFTEKCIFTKMSIFNFVSIMNYIYTTSSPSSHVSVLTTWTEFLLTS